MGYACSDINITPCDIIYYIIYLSKKISSVKLEFPDCLKN